MEDASSNPQQVVAYELQPSTTNDFAYNQSSATIAVADVNLDGKLDLVLSRSASVQTDASWWPCMEVYLGDGRGGFSALAPSGFGWTNASVAFAVGDVDGDGDEDVLVDNQLYRNERLPGGNLAGFQADASSAFSTPSMSIALAFGDADNDGDLDLAVVGTTQVKAVPGKADGVSDAMLYLNDGLGGFTPKPNPGAPFDALYTSLFGQQLAFADFNGDGNADLMVGMGGVLEYYPQSPATMGVRLLLGDGGAQFVQAECGIEDRIGWFALGDADADGDLDWLTVNPTNALEDADVAQVWLNNGTAYFARHASGLSISAASASIALADMDADGDVRKQDQNPCPRSHSHVSPLTHAEKCPLDSHGLAAGSAPRPHGGRLQQWRGVQRGVRQQRQRALCRPMELGALRWRLRRVLRRRDWCHRAGVGRLRRRRAARCRAIWHA